MRFFLLGASILALVAAKVQVEVIYDSDLGLAGLEALDAFPSSSVDLTLRPVNANAAKGKSREILLAQQCAVKEAKASAPELVVKVAALVHCLRTWAPQIIGYIAYCWVSNYSVGTAEQVKSIENCATADWSKPEITKDVSQISGSRLPIVRVNGQDVKSDAIKETICNQLGHSIAACKQ
jgi:hypothetical protein